MNATQTQDLGNNETLTRGVVTNSDGTYTALTATESRTFKSQAGARRWFARRRPDLAVELWGSK